MNKSFYFPRYSGLLFVAVFLLLSFVYNYHNILHYRPQGTHQWRQTDCLSFSLNYYRDHNPLLEPSIHFLGTKGTGKTVSEFPILYYLTAQVWKVVGYHEWVLRVINMLIVFCGLFALFKLAEDMLRDTFLGLCVPVLLFTSPVLAYYTNNFLPNAPALGLTLVGWFFFWKFYQSGKNTTLSVACLFFAFAGLLKVTSAMSMIALVVIFLLEALNLVTFRTERKIFAQPVKQFTAFIAAFAILLAWYAYGYWYNYHNEHGIFLIGTYPIWGTTDENISRIFLAIREQAKWSYFRPVIYLALLFITLFLAAHYKRVNRFLAALTILLVLGVLSFMILFFEFLDVHDYYMIDTFLLIPVFFLFLFSTLRTCYPAIFQSAWLKILLLALVIHTADFANRRMDSRYAGWMNEEHLERTHVFENITPYLRSIGITRDDKVICLPDPSLEITLYLMDQKGWTDFSGMLARNGIPELIDRGAQYLIIYDKALHHHPAVQPYLTNKVSEYATVEIFRLE